MLRRRTALGICLAAQVSFLTAFHETSGQEPNMLRVMTFNIWIGGESGKQPLEQTARVIQDAHADIVGLQEVCGSRRGDKRPDNAQKIAEQLSWQYFSQGDDDTAVMTRHKIISHTPRKWGVEIELPTGQHVWLFNAHFPDAPYQPYQLLKIPYGKSPFLETAEQAVQAARDARGKQVASMLSELKAAGDEAPIFVTGDFNEPSALDWTEAARAAGHHPLAVPWPTCAAVLGEGFVDAYRERHGDPVADPGNTWTPTTKSDDPQDHHDRIDFVLARGRGVRVEKSEVVGEDADHANIVVSPYPSDHRAVVATVALP